MIKIEYTSITGKAVRIEAEGDMIELFINDELKVSTRAKSSLDGFTFITNARDFLSGDEVTELAQQVRKVGENRLVHEFTTNCRSGRAITVKTYVDRLEFFSNGVRVLATPTGGPLLGGAGEAIMDKFGPDDTIDLAMDMAKMTLEKINGKI